MRWAARVGLIGMACALALGLLWPSNIRAQAERVRLNIGPSGAESEAIAAVITELLHRLPVEVVFDREGHDLSVDPHAYVAKVVVDLREPRYAVLLVEDPTRDRLLAKRVVRTPGRDELAREEIGHMALAAVEAVIAGATIGSPRVEALRALTVEVERERQAAKEQEQAAEPAPPRPEPAPPAPQPEREPQPPAGARAFQLSAALLYELALLGDEPGVAHGPVLALAVRSPWPLALGVLGSVQYRFPLEVDSAPVGMRSRALALRALATIEHAASARLALRFGLGGGADIARIEPVLAAGASARTTERRTLALAVARGLAGVDFRMSPWLSLWIAVAADLDLDESQYVLIDGDGAERIVSEPWRVRPSLLIGAALP
jgi:hypothetical protein